MSYEPKNAKAFYRRALCHKEVKKYDHCISDLKSLFQFEPNNVQARKLADDVSAIIDKVEVAEKKHATAATAAAAKNNTSSSTQSSKSDKQKVKAKIENEIEVIVGVF